MSHSPTPCPVRGIVDEDDSAANVSTQRQSWLSSALGLGLGLGLGGSAAPVMTHYTPPTITVAYAPVGSTCEPEVLTLVVRPAMTLKDVHAAAAARFNLQPQGGLVIHASSTRQPLQLCDLHAPPGTLVSAYVHLDLDHAQRTTKPDEAAKPPSPSVPVPCGPPPRLLGKNADDLHPSPMISSLRLMRQYGPLFRLSLPNADEAIFVCDPDIAEQVLTRPEVWGKVHMKNLKFARAFVGRGLFTSDDDEPIWHQAHRILLPAFSNQGMRGPYFQVVQDTILQDLFPKWDALAATGAPVDMTEWAERFTFDVIGKVAFYDSFNAIQNGSHPYLETMVEASAAAEELRSFSFLQTMVQGPGLLKKFEALNQPNIDFVGTIVAKRKAELEQGVETNRTDLLTLMLTSKDPRTGECLPADNVVDQILTFLFAGHDSTSTALTILLMLVAMHGEVERKIVEEVERVVGDGPLTFEKLGRLEYCTAAINEALRMFPPAQMIRKTATEDVSLGPYQCTKGTAALISLWGLAHNPWTWPDPWRFDPDRWLGERGKALSPFASLPFSYGPRACIGRQLSIMEQRSLLVHTVRRYHIRLHSRAHAHITTPAFIKPHGVILCLERKGKPSNPQPQAQARLPEEVKVSKTPDTSASLPLPLPSSSSSSSLLVLYGSNLGTCQAYAAELAEYARLVARLDLVGTSGVPMSLDQLAALDEAERGRLAREAAAVIVISSTYNGTPPDNATSFMRLVESEGGPGSVFGGVPFQFAVFGAGNSQWARTYQAVPTRIDDALHAANGVRVLDLCCGDADVDVDDAFDEWKRQLLHRLQAMLGIESTLAEEAEVSSAGLAPAFTLEPAPAMDAAAALQVANDFARANGLFQGEVLENRELQDVDKSHRSTRHIEVKLPEGVSYTAGDHLAVYGGNPPELVERAAGVVGVGLDEVFKVTLASSDKAVSSIIPLQVPLRVKAMLTWCVELQQIATRSQISYIKTRCPCPPEQAALEGLVSAYEVEVLKARRTVLELLETYKSARLSLVDLLSILPPMKVRYYSISSSPRVDSSKVSITVGVVNGHSPTGREHLGVCSNFLCRQPRGAPVRCFVKDTKSTFRLPPDGSTPVILVGPGTGLAPLRGFLQDREATKAKGKALLFFGCRNEADMLYREELEGFVARGVLTALHVALSRPTGPTNDDTDKKQPAKKYVQHLIRDNASQVRELLQAGGHVYVCGDAKAMAPDVRLAIGQVLAGGASAGSSEGKGDDKDKEKWVGLVEAMVSEGRYHEDVWAS